jgi:hypothetical protein
MIPAARAKEGAMSQPGPSDPATPAPYREQGVPSAHQTDGLAVAALVLGIVGLFTFWILMIVPILAVILGLIARRQIREPHGTRSGREMAVIAVVTGSIGIALFFLPPF